MKVNNTSVFMGNTKEEWVQTEDRGNHNVFAGDLKLKLNPAEQKKQAAKEQAMKIVENAFEGDRKIDADIAARRDRIAALKKDIGKAGKEINEIEEIRETLKESYGILPDSSEEKELQLLEKEMDAKMSWKRVSLSKEEREELARIKAKGLTEYQQRSLELKEAVGYYEKQIYESDLEISTQEAVIRGIRLERLKDNPMEKAKKQADTVLDAAGEEILGMFMQDGKKHIDEELEEKKEVAEKKREEAKELEEKLNVGKKNSDEQEELTEAVTEASHQLTDIKNIQNDVQDEVKKLLDKMKLLEEDIKGASVDENI